MEQVLNTTQETELSFEESFKEFLAKRGVLGDISELEGVEIVLTQPERTVKDIDTIFKHKDNQ